MIACPDYQTSVTVSSAHGLTRGMEIVIGDEVFRVRQVNNSKTITVSPC
jgi:hypothetical protein